MGDDTRPVTITTTGTTATITVNDTDMSNDLIGYDIQHRAGQPPLMVLHLKPGIDLHLEGVATVAVAQETLPGELIAQFLDAIDPAALDAAILNRDLDGGKHELTTAMLQQLADWAQGKVN